MNKKQIKNELASAVQEGVAHLMRTTHGSNMLGISARLTRVDTTTVQLVCRPDSSGPVYFEIKVKERI